MTTDFAVQVIYNGVILTILISAPAVGIGLVVGFIISLFQAVTQIQEQTLSFVPKVAASIIVLVILGPWMLRFMVEFTQALILSLARYAG